MLPPAGSVKSSQLCGDANYSRVRSEERPMTPHNHPSQTNFESTLPISPRYIDQKMNRREFLIGKRAIAYAALL